MLRQKELEKTAVVAAGKKVHQVKN